MPITRSGARATTTSTTSATAITEKKAKAIPQNLKGKRKAAQVRDQDELEETEVGVNGKSGKSKKARVTKKVVKTTTINTSNPTVAQPLPFLPDEPESEALVPAKLSFSFEDAKAHLIKADSRFKDVFERLECKPYEQLEMVHPFRALTTSILGQQISWLAARSINHKFIRMFNPDIPENYADYADAKSPTSFFPTPRQVAEFDLATLRTAGLSQRKAEYVHDLATRFADGRLSTRKLLAVDDEQLAQMLIEVRGIGRWTVDMFAIFSLRRPDILPVGDLGVQRGLVRWFLALHSPSYNVVISPQKESRKSKIEQQPQPNDTSQTPTALSSNADHEAVPSDLSSLPPAPVPVLPATPIKKNKSKKKGVEVDEGPIPPPFTPSIKTALRKAIDDSSVPSPLPEGLSVSVLKSRLEGKKKVKGAFLTPNEMEELTESWRPYRSLGVYYMWALAEADVGDD
ncbi:DNA glycosylase [Marasmius fiardii PR-910]|nr:DNA glycosylase [Marasmius fiardii PR-910]